MPRSGSIKNVIEYGSDFENSLNYVIYRFLYVHGDEFSAEKFMDRYHEAIVSLETVNETQGKSSDKTLREKGYRRKKIRGYKYIIVYSYDDDAVLLHGVYNSTRDFSKIF